MKFIDRVDEITIDFYQKIIDKTGLKVKQAIFISILMFLIVVLCHICYSWVNDGNVYYGGIVMLFLYSVFRPSKETAQAKVMQIYRIMGILFFTMEFLQLLDEVTTLKIISAVHFFLLLSAVFFAACKDAPPRKKISQIQFQGA